MATHALVTGVNITGRVPVPEHPDGWVDVTPDVLYFEHDSEETPDVVYAVAHAIEVEHHVRGTHPVQLACKALNDPSQYDPADPAHAAVREQMIAAHQAEHAALNERIAANERGPVAR